MRATIFFMKPTPDEHGSLATLEPPTSQLPATHAPIHTDWGDEDETPTGFKKWRAPLIVGVLTLTGICFAVKALSKSDNGGLRKENVTVVQLQLPPAPPPPPPPPPPPETMKVEEMIKQEEEKEEEPDPTPVIDTALKGPSSGGLVVAQQRPGNFFGKRSDGGKTKWGWYASQVQARLTEALRKNARTRKASGAFEVKIWADPGTGRIQKAALGSSTGDLALDAAIIDAFQGAQLQQPPPEGMPMPIHLRVTARRPN